MLLSRPFQSLYLSCAAVCNVADLCLTRTCMACFGNVSRISLVDKTDTTLQLGPKTKSKEGEIPMFREVSVNQ